MGEIGKYSDAGENQRHEAESYKEIRPAENLSVQEAKEYWDEKFSVGETISPNGIHEEGKREKPIEKVIPCGMTQFLETCDRNEITKDKIHSDVYGRSTEDFKFNIDLDSSDIKKSLSQFQEPSWNCLDMDEKKECVQQFATLIGETLDLEHPPEIKYYTASQDECGEFDSKHNVVRINENNFDSPKEIVDTVAHEMRHAYQFQRSKKIENYQDFLYAYNFEHYIPPTFFLDYQDQLIESEAQAFADLFAEK